MQINSKYVVLEKCEEVAKEGFKTVEVQDNFIYKGKVIRKPDCPCYVDSYALAVGDVVIFAKYSPDTHDIELEGKKVKFVRVEDLLAVIN
jgi:co-chaperonin GroES (HSP10)